MNLLDLSPPAAAETLRQWLAERGPGYRYRQVAPRLWQRPVASWEEATDLPRELRAALDEAFPLPRLRLLTSQLSKDGTRKFLWGLADGAAVESVLIPEGRRQTLCISSQSGCAYGCVFCATGRMGFERHLATWEIVAQVRELALDPELGKPTNVVFMGMGEPLHNWDAVDRALTTLNHTMGLGIGARHITVSTVGVVPNLRKLAARPEQFRLALSLHAPTHEQRLAIMPVEKKYSLDRVLPALQAFKRRITFEYVMISGKNDSLEDADRLAALAAPLGALVNLLPLHPGGTPGLMPASAAHLKEFGARLEALGVTATVRRSRGLDIDAACGQLRVAIERRRQVAAHQDASVE
ncbi:MAG: 23S rRNA (adenine(2503)-C(2))-methyltransferase RlmN [Gemmatimonadetes bacterium]|nr:23S rRNA (adenine(2503)-C(2))-methyltransferase RlmN [Gemmatimonadota bacterium]